MTIRTLNIFSEVAKCGNMTMAARNLYISQPSISQAISDIEKEFGVVLFERRPHKGLALTKTGSVLLLYAKQLIALYGELENSLRCDSNKEYLRIGATVTVGNCVICDIIGKMRSAISYPVELSISVDNTHILEQMLLDNELDIALVEGRVTNSKLEVKPCMQDNLVLICAPSHRFCGRDFIEINELSSEKFVLREKGSGTRAQIEDCLALHKVDYSVVMSSTNFGAIINAVKQNFGISILSEKLVYRDLVAKNVWACKINDFSYERYFSIVYNKSRAMTRAMAEFATQCYFFT